MFVLKIPSLVFEELINFFLWWYKDVPLFFVFFLKNTLLAFANIFAVPTMLRSFFIPIFHDYSLIGRILSFIFRLIRITTGLIVNFFLLLILSFLFLIWLCLPVFIILKFLFSLRGFN